MSMEEQPQRELSNSDIDDTMFLAHWDGYEEAALKILESPRESTIEIKRDEKTIGIFHPKKKYVVSTLEQGPLTLSYAAFVLRIKNTDNFEQKPLEYYQQLPSRNGVRIDNPPDQPLLTVYHNLVDQIGSKHETQGEEDSLIEKSRRKCWCCSLY